MIKVTKVTLPPLEKYNKYLDKIWENNWITNNGEFASKLEKKLEKFLGVNNLSLVSNGTLSLQLICKAFDLKGEIITTPFTFPATTNAILWEGLTPVFADIDPNTFNIDPKDIENKITKNTSAILAVHVFGNPCNVEALQKIGKKHNIKIVYDAAHAFGVKYKGRSILRWGDANSLSFHATKIFHTAEGGAIITNKKRFHKKVHLYRNHGIGGSYKFVVAGTNAKVTELQAAMGLCMLPLFRKQTIKRGVLYRYYKKHLSSSNIKFQRLADKTIHSYPYFPVVFNSEKTRDRIYKTLLKNDIEARKYFYPPAHEFPHVKQIKHNVPVATEISHNVLCLPFYPDLHKDDADRIIDVVLKYAN